FHVTGVQTCALPISGSPFSPGPPARSRCNDPASKSRNREPASGKRSRQSPRSSLPVLSAASRRPPSLPGCERVFFPSHSLLSLHDTTIRIGYVSIHPDLYPAELPRYNKNDCLFSVEDCPESQKRLRGPGAFVPDNFFRHNPFT